MRAPRPHGPRDDGFDFINDDPVANDDNGHGTHVAGIIAAKSNNKIGIAGVSRARIYAVKVLAADGYGHLLRRGPGHPQGRRSPTVKVINLSLGRQTRPSITLQTAVDYAVNTKGKLLVAAAGNDDSTDPFYPAAYSLDYPERVLAVGASGLWVTGSTDGKDYFIEQCRADYSNHGDYVNITAPGTDIYSTQPWKKDFYNHRYGGCRPGSHRLRVLLRARPWPRLTWPRWRPGSSATTSGSPTRQVGHRLLAQAYQVEVGPSFISTSTATAPTR